MRTKRRLLPLMVVNGGILSVFLFTQNCGRVGVQEQIELPSVKVSPLSVSVSSELVIPVNVNEEKVFSVPTNNGSAQVKRVSFSQGGSPLYEARSNLNGDIVIDPASWNMTYTPPVGMIGEDASLIYVTGSDGSVLEVKVLFVITNPRATSFPELNALVYDASAQDRAYLANKLAGYAPPGMSEIFNKWGRFSGGKWFSKASEIKIPAALSYCDTGVDPATGLYKPSVDPVTKAAVNPSTHTECVNDADHVAKSWILRSSPDRIYCATNAGKLTGFVSPLNFEYYRHEAIVTSANSDDDTIGLVIAFHRDESGNNHVLAAVRTHGGNAPRQGWGILYYKNGSHVKTLGEADVGGVHMNGTNGSGDKKGWNNRMSKIQVIRQGNLVTAYASAWNSVDVDENSKLTVDLGDSSKGVSIFKGARPYGYMSLSQLGSEYRGVQFSTGQPETYVYDLANRIVYEKQASGDYVPRTDLDAYTHIGAPRKVGNPDTGKIFQLKANKTYDLLN